MRKYAPLWNYIKEHRKVTIEVPHDQQQTVKNMLMKEKNLDRDFKASECRLHMRGTGDRLAIKLYCKGLNEL